MDTRLLSLRKAKGLKQAEVAKAIGCKPQLYGRWERGENPPSIEYGLELAKLYKVGLDYLYFGKEAMTFSDTPIPYHDLKRVVDDLGLIYKSNIDDYYELSGKIAAQRSKLQRECAQ